MQALDTRHIVVDATNEGTPYVRNAVLQCKAEDHPTSLLTSAPWGHGVSVFQLGAQPSLICHLEQDDEALQQLTQTIADSMPNNAPPNMMLQLGVLDNPESAALESGPKNQPLTLCVWGNDPDAAAAFEATTKKDMQLATQREEPYTIRRMLHSKADVVCNEKSREYRKRTAMSAIQAMNAVAELKLPDELFSTKKDEVYDTTSINLVTVETDHDNTTTAFLDYNSSEDAVIFHSPSRGSTLLIGEGPRVVVPASDGRNVEHGDRHLLQQEFPEIVGAEDVVPPSLVKQNLMRAAVSNAPVASGCATAIQVLPLQNNYASPDSFEGSFKKTDVFDYISSVPSGTKMYRIRALATCFPAVQRANGKLAGSVSCEDIKSVLEHTHASEGSLYFPNTPQWSNELTEADPQKRPFALMNEKTSIMSDTGCLTHFKVDRELL